MSEDVRLKQLLQEAERAGELSRHLTTQTEKADRTGKDIGRTAKTKKISNTELAQYRISGIPVISKRLCDIDHSYFSGRDIIAAQAR